MEKAAIAIRALLTLLAGGLPGPAARIDAKAGRVAARGWLCEDESEIGTA